MDCKRLQAQRVLMETGTMTYQIKETREYYGPKTTTCTVADYFGEPETFATREAAQARIDAFESGPYMFDQGESARPTYKIVKPRA